MAYLDLYSEELTRKLKKIKNKNRKLYDVIDKKIAEIIQHPERYKELRHDMGTIDFSSDIGINLFPHPIFF